MTLIQNPFQMLVRFALLVAFAVCGTAATAAVQAPPLPVGSAQVRIVAGQSPAEQNRMARAHKHHSPAHFRKDMTRDDTLDGASTSRRYGSGVEEPTPPAKSTGR